jgi:hypothetical protein
MSRRNRLARVAAVAVAAAGLLAAATPAHAFRMIQNFSVGRVTAGALVTCTDPGGFTHWGVANTNWRHNTAGQGGGVAKAAAVFNGMNVWAFNLGANHTLTYAGTTSAGFATDGINAVSWGTGQGCGGGCLALTALVLQSGQLIVESDVTFNSGFSWNTNGSDYDVWAVAAHEFGHTLGIHHSEISSSPLPTMYAFYQGTPGRSLETDDHSALQCSQNRYPPTVSCIPNGGVDDTLFNTSCCSGVAVSGSTYCTNPADFGTTWASCHHLCATPLVGGCVPAGGVDDTLNSTRCCSGAAVQWSTRCLDPADYGTDWKSCIHTCL